jgi:hypothetical protein
MFYEQANPFWALQEPRRLGHVLAIATAILALALVPLIWGFIAFVRGIHELERPVERADAIVALSGDPERLWKAVSLLAEGYAGRLLITGPNKRIVISRLVSLQPVLFASRVDIDPLPRNTIGDADAARRWVNKHGFASMIVVSSNYHMPRAMLELDHALPHVRKLPHPVVGGIFGPNRWLGTPAPLGLLASEYAKYMVRRLQMSTLGGHVFRSDSAALDQ